LNVVDTSVIPLSLFILALAAERLLAVDSAFPVKAFEALARDFDGIKLNVVSESIVYYLVLRDAGGWNDRMA
tara:strand:+ start:113 stop:328 length:216 start_codon:yes stop_codon:yes gene_type:complete